MKRKDKDNSSSCYPPLRNPPAHSTPYSRANSDSSCRDSHTTRKNLDWEKLRLRNFRPRDLEVLVQIDSLCFPDVIAYNKETLLEYLKHKSMTVFIVEYGRQVIGFALAVYQKKENCIHLVTLDIIPQYQGMGAGKWVLGAVLQMAISVKAVRIRLEVAATNQKAIGLYRRFGFRIAGRLANYYADNTDGLFMILWLRGPKSRFGMCFKQKLAYNRRRPEC